jgi:hypothetical protein
MPFVAGLISKIKDFTTLFEKDAPSRFSAKNL